VQGHNPYAQTYSNIYTPDEIATFYGPNVVVDGRISFGYPYPPVTLLLALPGYVAGDVRIASVILSFAALFLFHVFQTGGRYTDVYIVTFATLPGLSLIWWSGWIEGLILPLIVVLVVCANRAWLALGSVLLGLCLVSKQYFALTVPALWLLRAYFKPYRLLLLVGSGLAVSLPWMIADPGAFFRAVIGSQAVSDVPRSRHTLSLAYFIDLFGGGPDWVLFVAPIIGSLGLACYAALTFPPRLCGFLLAAAVCISAGAALSRQGFFHYYFFAAEMIVLSAASQAGELDRVDSVTEGEEGDTDLVNLRRE
jgi:hypothetical protein